MVSRTVPWRPTTRRSADWSSGAGARSTGRAGRSTYAERVDRGTARAAQTVADVAAWADDAFARLTGLTSVHRAGLALVEGGGRRLRFTASDRDGGDQVPWCDVDGYDDVPLNTAVRTGRPVIGSLADLHDRYPAYASRQHGTPTSALAAVPLVAAGRVLGGYLLLFDTSQAFGRAQRTELSSLGRELGEALRRAQGGDRRRSRSSVPRTPLPPGARMAVHDVAPDPAAVGGARRFLRATLQHWGVHEDVADAAVLCLSELVTNAVIHSHGGSLVQVVLDERVLTTTVRDWGTTSTASVRSVDDPLQVHGRGLQLVDALADRWGYDLDGDGASVWFSLDVRST
jgi:anti-sigma regulatory factor (Ser/Thr protein kinase)